MTLEQLEKRKQLADSYTFDDAYIISDNGAVHLDLEKAANSEAFIAKLAEVADIIDSVTLTPPK